MKTFKYTNNSKLCSEHFIDGKGPTIVHPIPSVFRTKVFRTSRLDESMLPETKKLPADQEVCESDTSISSTDSKEKGYVTSESVLDTSVFFHNYTGTPRVLSTIRHQYSETTPAVQVSTDTQTDVTDVKTKFETSTQTDAKKTVDVGIQVSLPQLTFDDIRGDDQKCVFYTGIPESSTFEALFQEIVLDAEECTGGNRDKSVGGRPRTLRIIDEFFYGFSEATSWFAAGRFGIQILCFSHNM